MSFRDSDRTAATNGRRLRSYRIRKGRHDLDARRFHADKNDFLAFKGGGEILFPTSRASWSAPFR